MYLLKWLLRGLCSSLFRFSLFLLAMTATLTMVFGRPNVLKQSLADSGAYNSFIGSALESAQKEQGPNSSDIPLDTPEIKTAVQTAFPPEFLRTNTEQVIDSIYSWLQGKTPTPSFQIDVTAARQSLTTSLADYAANRASSLPACTLAQVRELQGSDVDPFNASCLPPGISAATIRQKVTTDLSGNSEFLKEPVYTETTLPKNEKGMTLFQQAKQAPDIYSKAMRAPYVFAAIAVLSAVGVVLLYESRRRGLRSIGFSFLSVGVVVLVSTWLVGYGMNKAKGPDGPFAKFSENNLQHALIDLVTRVTATLNSKLYIFCFTYIVLGTGLLITLKLTAQKQPPVTTGIIDELAATTEKQPTPKL